MSLAVLGPHRDSVSFRLDTGDRHGRPRAGQTRHHAFHVFARTAVHREPRMMRADAEESMIVEKPYQRGGGKIQRATRGDTPDRSAHRHEVKPQEVVAETVEAHELVKRHRLERLVLQGRIGHAKKPHDLRQQPEVTRPHQIPPLGEDSVQAHPVVFHIESLVPHAETHLGRLDRHPQLLEQSQQIRVGYLVEDHEPGVDRHPSPVFVHLDGVRMTTDMSLTLENRDVVAPPQQPRRAQSGDAAADDGQAFFAHSEKCSVGVPADESVVIGAGDGAATLNTLTPRPARRSAHPRGRRSRAPRADF